jgi:hypothetical protein
MAVDLGRNMHHDDKALRQPAIAGLLLHQVDVLIVLHAC